MKIAADAILFDNDGVLVDSHPQVVAAWSQLATEFDLDYELMSKQLVGQRAEDTLARFVPPSRLAEAISRLEDLEVELADQTPSLTGALDLLDSLALVAPGRWAIVTSASSRLAMARWTGANIPVPNIVVTAEDVHAGKPNPEPFLAGAHRLGYEPQRCVVFEDSPAGGAAATAAGAIVIAVGDIAWTETPHARVPNLANVSVTASGDGTLIITL